MVRRRKPTIRAVWLGQALREIRDEAGLSSKDAGAHLGCDASSIIRIEAGEMPVTSERLDLWLEMCGVSDPRRRSDLFTIRKDVGQTGWWDGYRADVAPLLMDRAWMESKAHAIRTVELTYLPGLLQTPEYAEALMRAWHPEVPDSGVESWVALRMNRQQILSKHRPIRFTTIISEHLLGSRTGGAKAMRVQLDRLLELSERPNIEVHVLPLGVTTGLGGSFEVFGLAKPYPEVAYAVIPAGDICLEGEPVEQLSEAYDRLLGAALDPAASRHLIIAERDKL
ncbi:helix-turn-helix transcriptional regulator [Phytomonospora sp. NPDC050363]|uniref:helix-turn-helix domain-containing protein n=1 Tax=Phytomonospora sp. NPDC050363 TaxID=3155642 RepID=UPI0033D8EBD8